jgi:uncharacterized protein (TIGR02391 family)
MPLATPQMASPVRRSGNYSQRARSLMLTRRSQSGIGSITPSPTIDTRQARAHILAFIRKAMRPERFLRCPERFEPMRALVNGAVAFAGLAIDESGVITPVEQARTLSEAQRRAQELRADLATRGVHPDVLLFCREELVVDNYVHAVLEAVKSVADKIRTRTGLTNDGNTLIDRALAGDLPMLAINLLKTESEKSEQKGFANLSRGTFGMFRNTTAHEARIHWPIGKDDAEDLAKNI